MRDFFKIRERAAVFAAVHDLSAAEVIEQVLDRGFVSRSGEIAALRSELDRVNGDGLKVVVLGGGTGLSNLIGGDSRGRNWWQNPFSGLKEFFPHTTAVVCVTDDGGSTGVISSHLPLIALGDLRHVILSAVSRERISAMSGADPNLVAAHLHRLINYRLNDEIPKSPDGLWAAAGGLESLPPEMAAGLSGLGECLFSWPRLNDLLTRGNCLGNLLLTAAVVSRGGEDGDFGDRAVREGINDFASILGAGTVVPCATVPAALRFLYANGVEVTGEYKSAHARRGLPVAGVRVCFAGEVRVDPGLEAKIKNADLIVMAPGSLYSSVIPVLQTPGIVAAIRGNRKAVKVLVANIWVQAGETDLVYGDPLRRFQVSDLLRAYDLNIPGGVAGLFHHVLCLGLRDIPGSVLRNYGVEGKVPIYLDAAMVRELGFVPIEARIHSAPAMATSGVVQHDPTAVARALKGIFSLAEPYPDVVRADPALRVRIMVSPDSAQNRRMIHLRQLLAGMVLPTGLEERLLDILARHRDIPTAHFDRVRGIKCMAADKWRRDQAWDRLYSFYDPGNGLIYLREDVVDRGLHLELAFLAALGQSLLGDYAAEKRLAPVLVDGREAGRIFTLRLKPVSARACYFAAADLGRYLELARMQPHGDDKLFYTRLINDDEGFTPPGMLFGLVYAWYLDNRLAGHIEYKMAILKQPVSGLVPEQVRTADRRRAMIGFFRQQVFGDRGARIVEIEG